MTAQTASRATVSDDDVQLMARWIVSHYVGSKDWACAECDPGGDTIISGFVCAPHLAARLTEGSDHRDPR